MTRGLRREVDSWGGGTGGWAGGAWRHCKLRITSSAVCEGRSAAVPGLRETPSGPLTGGVMEPGLGGDVPGVQLTDGPSGRCPRWPGRPGPCQGR